MAMSIITRITSRTEATTNSVISAIAASSAMPCSQRIEIQPRQRERRGAHRQRAQQPARDPRQVLELADAARVDDREHLPPPHDAAAEEAQHRQRHRAQREVARCRREIGVAEELEHAGVDRQEVGDRHAEMRAAGEQQVEEAEPDRAGDQRGQRRRPVGADRGGDQADQQQREAGRAQPVPVQADQVARASGRGPAGGSWQVGDGETGFGRRAAHGHGGGSLLSGAQDARAIVAMPERRGAGRRLAPVRLPPDSRPSGPGCPTCMKPIRTASEE